MEAKKKPPELESGESEKCRENGTGRKVRKKGELNVYMLGRVKSASHTDE
jgi:hypothetical protein